MNAFPKSEHLDQLPARPQVPATWDDFIHYCQHLGHGEIEKLKIQDVVPVMAEVVGEKVNAAVGAHKSC